VRIVGAPSPAGGCGLGSGCPVLRARQLRDAYHAALDRLDAEAAGLDASLRQATFAASVVQWLAKHPEKAGSYLGLKDKYDEGDIWERLLDVPRTGDATSFETTDLRAYIMKLEARRRTLIREAVDSEAALT